VKTILEIKMLIRKKSVVIIISLFLIFFSSCKKNATEAINEPAGLAKYFIDNQSTKILSYGDGTTAIKILPSEIKKIDEDGGIGIVAPLPSKGLGSIKLYRNVNGKETVVYEQNPIIDSYWVEEKQDNQEYGVVHFTLVISEEKIK